MEVREKLAEIDRELETFGKSDRVLDEVRERAFQEAPTGLSAIDAALTLIERESGISSRPKPTPRVEPPNERPEAEPGAHQSLSDLLSEELRAELEDVLDGSLPLDGSHEPEKTEAQVDGNGTPEEFELTIDEELFVVEATEDVALEVTETPRTSTRPPPPPTRPLSARPARIPNRSLPRK
jgi:hypothetical protein